MKQPSSKQLAEFLRDAVRADDRNRACELFEEGVIAEPETFIASVKKSGALRSSQAKFRTAAIKAVIGHHKTLDDSQATKPAISTYLSSIGALLFIADSLKETYRNCCAASSHAFKNYLVTIDDLFWRNHSSIYGVLRTGYKHFSKEELAAAFSYYYSLLTSKTDIAVKDLVHLNDKRILTDFYRDKLSEIAKLVAFKEAELMVDSYDYYAEQTKKTVTIRPTNPRFEQCVRLGYIREELQQVADQEKITKGAPTLEEFVNSFPMETLDKLFLLETRPPRVAVRLPTEQFIRPLMEEEALLHNETLLVASVAKQLLINFAQFKSTPIYADITLWDLLKVRRLFGFIYVALKKWLNLQGIRSNMTYYHSLTPIVTLEHFRNILKFGLGDSKATTISGLLLWESDDGRLFDIQSQPVIKCENFVALPLGILAESHLTRNILQHTKFRFDSATADDPVTSTLHDCLKTVFDYVGSNIKYKFAGQEGEIDVLAMSDNILFIFECKNSLHPCSPFELRTSYDYVRKAAVQLTRILELCKQAGFLAYLGLKLKINLTVAQKIQTCIVMGNRMFAGWVEQGHSVRNLHELLAFVELGEITFASKIDPQNSYRGILKLWHSGEFTPADLVEYCGSDSYFSLYFDSMVETCDIYDMGGRKLAFNTYFLDMKTFDTSFRKNAVCSPWES